MHVAMSEFDDAFEDRDAVRRYAETAARMVPGHATLFRMVEVVLAERMSEQSKLLVVGAGGGLEIESLARAREAWSFFGVDPSPSMLEMAERVTAPTGARVELARGSVEVAPLGPFDGATCVLTLHFVELDARQELLRGVHERLRPGAPFVVVHLSLPDTPEARVRGLERYAAFAAASGVDPQRARAASKAVADRLTVLSPERDVAMLEAAGFGSVELFYAGLAFRGWVAYA